MTQDLIGTRKGDYEILALLGVGGMGQVYKVRNVLSDRVEAMKILLPNLADQKMLADRFIREIKVLAGLHHPNIAELRTALTIDNELVMIMEFVEGSPLSARVQQGGIPYGQALGYIQQVLTALSYAHSQKIIHRDIKPANMMLTPKGVVKLMDFGIARQEGDVALTTTNSTVGSIAYMSPEQVKGEPVDARSDLYSVGVSLYELVTGQRPFQGDTGFSIMRAHIETIPKPPVELRPDLPVGISDLILMAVAKDPAKRFQSADAFSRAISSLLPVVEGTAATSVIPASAPTIIAPSPLGTTTVSSAESSSFQATQVAAPVRSAPAQSAARPVAPVPSKPASRPAPPPPQNNYRGFYIALGALIVLVALTAAGFYLPRHLKTQAAQQTAASSDSNSGASNPASDSSSNASAAQQSPAASDAAGNNSSPAAANSTSDQKPGSPAGTPASSQSSDSQVGPASGTAANAPHINIPPRAGTQPTASTDSSAPATHLNVPPRAGSQQTASTDSNSAAPHINLPPRGGSAPGTQPLASTPSAPPANAPVSGAAAAPVQSAAPPATSATTTAKPAAADAPQLQQTETEVDQLSSRASAVSASLDGLRKQQAAQGLNLRGDMTAAEQRMQTNMSKAQAAIQAQDAAQAKHYLNLAEPDVEKLEGFLGH